jgi:hypothetical protein
MLNEGRIMACVSDGTPPVTLSLHLFSRQCYLFYGNLMLVGGGEQPNDIIGLFV